MCRAACRAGRRPAGESNARLAAGANVDRLVARLATLDGEDDGPERLAAYDRLAALFTVDPESVREATAWLSGTTELRDGAIVIGALGDSGAPHAQEGLVEIVRSNVVDDAFKKSALVHLALLEQPTEVTLSALRGERRRRYPKQLDSRARLRTELRARCR